MSNDPQVYRRVDVCRLSQDGRHRYFLRVLLSISPPRSLTVILKNPSSADAMRADPTVGKVEAWARQHDFTVVTYVNLFAYRSAHPHTLNSLDYLNAVGPENDDALRQAMGDAHVLAAAWGNPNGIASERYERRIAEVMRLHGEITGAPLQRVGALTHSGHPRHGLTWRAEMNLATFAPPR